MLALFGGRKFHPRRLFISDAVKGAIYDYDDYAYLYQKSDGSVPYTALEQPVGLVVDKRWGGAVGADVRSAGAPALLGTATAATFNTTTGAGSVTRVDSGNQSFVTFSGLATAGWYRYTLSVSAGTIVVRSGASGGTIWSTVSSASGTVTLLVPASSGNITISANGVGTATFTVSSLRELPGLHAYQSTDAARPVISARYNLLARTENVSASEWTKVGVTTSGAQRVIPNTQSSAFKELQQNWTSVTGADYTCRIKVKADGYRYVQIVGPSAVFGTFAINYDLQTGTETAFAAGTSTVISRSITAAEDGYYWITATARCLSGSATSRLSFCIIPAADSARGVAWEGDGTSAVLCAAQDVRLTADANGRLPAYQRVTTATDYDSAGFPRFLRIDATDDFLQTASVDPGTDKVFVCAGVTKMSDAAAAVLIESSAASSTTAGTFAVLAPSTNGGANYTFRSGGSTPNINTTRTTFASPATAVLSGTADIAGPAVALRVNQTGGNPVTTSQGTGNYSAQALYIGARASGGGTTRLNNGRIYPMIICFKAVTAGEIAATEAWVNARTRAY